MIKFKWETEFKQTEIGEVPREWEVQKIKEIGEVAGGTTPSTKKKEYWDGKIPWLTPKDLRDYEYVYISKGERNITEKAVKECSLKIFPEGTVLLTTRAPIGYVAIAKNQITTNQGFRNIVPHKIKSEYLYYYLKNVTDYLKSLAGGSTFGELTGSTLKEVLIPYPPLPEQSRIATVLSWFDDLIENKKRQNEILEKVAMAIFKSWFVDFEPFKDEEFVYSEELGIEIPEGWEVRKIRELIKIESGGSAPQGKNILQMVNILLCGLNNYPINLA
ncbi:MAG: restriction endonuclease subunit S [Methanophagales archaeon]|nr:restriction endonuclease subunit S [Methanophagales archaeon]